MAHTWTGVIRRVGILAFIVSLLGATAAYAQTTTAPPYPGTPTTVPAAPTRADLDLGQQEVGAILNVSECNFAVGAVIHIVVNGTAIVPDVVADSTGCIVVRIEVLPTLVSTPISLGRSPLHPFAATGLAATATNVQIKVNGQTLTVGPYGTVVTVVSTGTGSNGQPRTVTFKFTVVKRGTIKKSSLVRTGTTVVQWTPLGLGLVGIGYLMVLATRRRRHSEA